MAPNILWLMTDEQRADSAGWSGAAWAHTPNLDALAAAGTCFMAAYTPSPVCVSARACLLTGRAGSSIGMLNNHHWLNFPDPRFLTWRLAASGYQIASFGKQHYGCTRRAFDFEGGRTLDAHVDYYGGAEDSAPVRYEGGEFPWLLAGRHPGPMEEIAEMQNVADALAWVRRRDPSRPYFLRLSFNAPHTPTVAPAPYDTLIDPDTIDLPLDFPDTLSSATQTQRDFFFPYQGTQRLTPEQIRRARQSYYGRVAFADAAFGQLIDGLREMGALDNTIVAFLADHGAHLGDHAMFQKQSFFEESAKVPFFISGPGIGSASVETPVSTGSLMPTLLALAGVEMPEGLDYESVLPASEANAAQRPIFSEIDLGLWGRYRNGDRRVMVRDGRWKLWLYRDPADRHRLADSADPALYDLETDPGERHNLADDLDYVEVMGELIAKIDDWDDSRTHTAPSLTGKRA